VERHRAGHPRKQAPFLGGDQFVEARHARYGNTVRRRDFLRRAAVTGTGLAIAPSVLAACGGDSGDGDGSLSIGTPDAPVTLPTVGEAIADGLSPESGTLELLNWADYANPESLAAFEAALGVKVNVTIYDNEEAALLKLRNGTFAPDVIMGMTDTALARLVAAELLQPLNKGYIPNFSNVIVGLQNPYYDLGAQYTVPYVIYGNGIVYRTDVIDRSRFTDGDGLGAMWDATYAGRLAVLDSYRDTISMALIRDGITDVNTGDEAVLRAAGDSLRALREATNPKVDILSYQELPAGNRDIAFTWAGDALSMPGYLPEGVDPNVIGFWWPPTTVTANDFMCIPRTSSKPVLAHAFINFFSDRDEALRNASFVGYQPALQGISIDDYRAATGIPESVLDALVTPERYESGLRMYSLEPAVDALWNDVWAGFTAG
jgi:spermidine/putrescine transport system substrate-binding protein